MVVARTARAEILILEGVCLFPPGGRLLFPQTKKIFDQCPVSGVCPYVRPSKEPTSVLVFLKQNCVFDKFLDGDC